MKVLVCGSRGYGDGTIIGPRLLALPPGTEIMHGGARGVDRWAAFFATANGIPQTVFKPDWDRHGKKAGIIRNNTMLDEQPDLVLAFWDGQSRGTKHTIDEARRRGIPVEIIAAAQPAKEPA